MTPAYPLAAVAHQPQLVLALSLLAVSPSIGGLLIRGDRGAAKSTAARGLAALLPSGGPFVNLPLGATEDRVVGTLDLEAALRGEAKLRSGLMAQADGGLLYIDEVNLLPDHLVDVLLDAAAMGVVRVQRDHLSADEPARFALVGSMNPEEGQLRPQFLDRFGLCVDVSAPQDPVQRAAIVRRRMQFEADPAAFVAHWQAQQTALSARLQAAHTLFAAVSLADDLLLGIADITTQAGVRSLRADLVLHRAARAHAALQGRTAVSQDDLHAVAALVLTHRQELRHRSPPSSPPPSHTPPFSPPPESSPSPSLETPPLEEPHSDDSRPSGEEVFTPTASPAPLVLPPRPERPGRVIGTRPDPQAQRLHLPATLQAAAMRGSTQLTREDWHAPVHQPAGGRRVLFVADASGSLGLSGRMGAVKGAMLEVLAVQGTRDRVALITFRGVGAELLLPWSSDAQAAEDAIRAAATGGRTPLAHALALAGEVLRGPDGRKAELILFTDGRANVPLNPGSDAWADALSQAAALRSLPGLRAQVVDTESGSIRLGRAAQLTEVLGAQLVKM